LFTLVDTCLTRMILKAQKNNLIIGLIEYLLPTSIAIL
jgi:hypothetical protein